jgi:hypothetical protein
MREVHFVQQASVKLKESRRHGAQGRYNNTNFPEGPGQATTNSSPLKQTIHSQHEVLHQRRRCGASLEPLPPLHQPNLLWLQRQLTFSSFARLLWYRVAEVCSNPDLCLYYYTQACSPDNHYCNVCLFSEPPYLEFNVPRVTRH